MKHKNNFYKNKYNYHNFTDSFCYISDKSIWNYHEQYGISYAYRKHKTHYDNRHISCIKV